MYINFIYITNKFTSTRQNIFPTLIFYVQGRSEYSWLIFQGMLSQASGWKYKVLSINVQLVGLDEGFSRP